MTPDEVAAYAESLPGVRRKGTGADAVRTAIDLSWEMQQR